MTLRRAEPVQQIQDEANSKWLGAAEAPLARNASTVAARNLYELTSLLARLQARGYDVRVP